MKLDLEPLALEPVKNELQLEPLDLEPVEAPKKLDLTPLRAAVAPIVAPIKALADFSARPETRESAVKTAQGVAVSAIEQPVKAGQMALDVLMGQPIKRFLEPPGAKSAYHPTIVGIVKEALSANPTKAISEQVPEIERMYAERYGEGLPSAVKKDIFGVLADVAMAAGGVAGIRGTAGAKPLSVWLRKKIARTGDIGAAVKYPVEPKTGIPTIPITEKEESKTGFTIAQNLEGKLPTEATLKPIIEAGGGKWTGIQLDEAGKPLFAMFDEPSGSTLMLPIDKVTSEGVRAKIEGFKAKTQALPESTAFDPIKYADEMTAKQEAARQGVEPTFKQKTGEFLMDVKRKIVDYASPIEDVLRGAIKKGATVPLTEHITPQIDRVNRTPILASQFMKDNGLIDVIQNVDNPNHAGQYAIARHSKEVAARGIETGRDLAKDAQLVEAFGEKYADSANKLNAYSQKLLDYTVDAGLVGSDTAKILRQTYPDYVPMDRIFNVLESEGAFGNKSIASLGKQTVVMKQKGSLREVENPMYSLMEKTLTAFEQGEKNKSARMLASYEKLPGNPFDIKEVKLEMTPIKQISKRGKEFTRNILKYPESKETFSFLDNGVKRVFETRPEIAQAAKAMKVQQLNTFERILTFPTRVLKAGVTGFNPSFIVRNIPKDQLSAFINSDHALRTSAANPRVFFKALLDTVNHGKLHDEMVRNGAFGTSFDIRRNQIIPSFERIRAGRNVGSRIAYTIKHPSEILRLIEDTIGRSEQLTRKQQYIGTKGAALKAGLSPREAEIKATLAYNKNTVDFLRRGEWGQAMAAIWAYLPANIQGVRTFINTARTKPAITAAKVVTTVFMPVAAATAWNLSDPKRAEVYKDISEFEKKNNLIIISNDAKKNDRGAWEGIIKFPISQEVNNIAGLPRRYVYVEFCKVNILLFKISSATLQVGVVHDDIDIYVNVLPF